MNSKLFIYFTLFCLAILRCSSPTDPEIELPNASITIIYPTENISFSEITSVDFAIETDKALVGTVEFWFDSEKQSYLTTLFDTSFYITRYTFNNFPDFQKFGKHSIELKLLDEKNNLISNEKIDGISKPKLYPPTFLNNEFNLIWSQYLGANFLRYEIFESESESMENARKIFETLQDINTKLVINGIGKNFRAYYQMLTYTATDTIISEIVCGSSYPKIVYTAIGDNIGNIIYNFELFSVDIDGKNNFQITNNTIEDVTPEFSPSGNEIVYISDREVCSINLNGTNHKHLSYRISDDRYPKYSKDGTKIFFLSQRESGINLFSMNNDGSEAFNVTKMANVIDEYDISPDETKIVFQYYDNQSDIWDIGIINSDGTNFINLTDNSTFESAYSPRFSSNGQYIAFESYKNNKSDIIFLSLQDTTKVNLTEEFVNNANNPQFSPDGSVILFYSTYGIYILDVNSMNITRIIDDNRARFPKFSPDGDEIVYTSEFNIFIANSDGTSIRQLTNDRSRLNQNPTFQPIQ